MKLTIGIPTANDFDGLFFTVQSLRMHHAEATHDCEFVVVDNAPETEEGRETKRFIESLPGANQYVALPAPRGTAAAKNEVFRNATGDWVLCLDSHVLLSAGVGRELARFLASDTHEHDLLHGPLMHEGHGVAATGMKPVWRGHMWGIWENDPRGEPADGEAFEIFGHGMGLFLCRRSTWPGFHPDFRGFGGEEGYLPERIRQQGGRVYCLPWLRWMHRFRRPRGITYTLTVADKFRNALIGQLHLGRSPSEALAHFRDAFSADEFAEIVRDAHETVSGAKAASGAAATTATSLTTAADGEES